MVDETAGEKLRRLRKSQALSIRGLAERASVDKETVFRLEHGRNVMQYETAWRLLVALGVEIEEDLRG